MRFAIRRQRGGTGAVIALAAALLLAAPAPGQQIDPKLRASVDQWIKDLDDAALDKRELAQNCLGDARFCSLMLIQARLFDPGLSEEQRLRLGSAAYRLFAATVRGAMGVQFSDSTPQGVVIGRTIEGFDSRVVLRPEDIIRSIDGRAAIDPDQVRALIISRDPGEEVELALLRNGEPLTVTLRMGRFDQLRERSGGPDERSLQLAWRVRLARLAKAAAADLPAPIDAVEVEAEQEDFDLARALEEAGEPIPMEDPGFGAPTLVAGGEPRNGSVWGAMAFLLGRGAMDLQDPMLDIRRELAVTQRNLIELQDDLREVQQVIEDPNTPAARRQEMIFRGQLMEAQLRQYESQVRALMDRLAAGAGPNRAVP